MPLLSPEERQTLTPDEKRALRKERRANFLRPFQKKIYFRDGVVVAAASENPKEFLGYFLVGWNYIAL